jgi:hypothetical protein
MSTPSPSPGVVVESEPELAGMSLSVAGTVFAIAILFVMVMVQLVSHITGCRGLSPPEAKKANAMGQKATKRFSVTGNYESSRNLEGGEFRPDSPNSPTMTSMGMEF